jgi:hypothetical protein
VTCKWIDVRFYSHSLREQMTYPVSRNRYLVRTPEVHESLSVGECDGFAGHCCRKVAMSCVREGRRCMRGALVASHVCERG